MSLSNNRSHCSLDYCTVDSVVENIIINDGMERKTNNNINIEVYNDNTLVKVNDKLREILNLPINQEYISRKDKWMLLDKMIKEHYKKNDLFYDLREQRKNELNIKQ